jgi:hypothetical protein
MVGNFIEPLNISGHEKQKVVSPVGYLMYLIISLRPIYDLILLNSGCNCKGTVSEITNIYIR